MTVDEPRFHEHRFTLALPKDSEYVDGASCPCGHTVVPDQSIPEGEAVRLKDDVTKVGLATIEDLNKLRTPFQTEAYFPRCPVKAARAQSGA